MAVKDRMLTFACLALCLINNTSARIADRHRMDKARTKNIGRQQLQLPASSVSASAMAPMSKNERDHLSRGREIVGGHDKLPSSHYFNTDRAFPVAEERQPDRSGVRGAPSKSSDKLLLPSDMTAGNGSSSFRRHLSSQLTGCCTSYIAYSASQMCELYEQDCESGDEPSHDSGDASCTQAGLSFIGISFSVNTAMGNPLSYQLCDQYPMENIIDRKYDELLRIGSIDPKFGGTSIEQVYNAMDSFSFPPFSIFPEYVKGGGGHHSSDDDKDSVPSGDVTLIVSVVDTYEDNDTYSTYEEFLYNIFRAMYKVNGGPCMDDHDTDPHVSMARGVKFKSSYHEAQYFHKVNLEVAVWQSMYPKGVVIGSKGDASFPPDSGPKNKIHVGYGNLYFFFDRANITRAFLPNRDLTSAESYYATLYSKGDSGPFYKSTTTINFDYNKGSGSKDKNQEYYEHNPYGWNALMAKHDLTDGWDLPPNCAQEGEAFFGIPLSRKSGSKLLSTESFQDQFDFEYLIDRNFTYMKEFGTNHGWLVGEILDNGAGSIVDKDTAHIPIFYTGTTNPEMGGMSLENLIKIGKTLNFGTLYIKPAFVFQDDDGSIKLQFEADANSALGYLYSNLCKMIGIQWNYDMPHNDLDVYTNCAMHAAGDRAKYGCGPNNGNNGGFCPQVTLAYRVKFQSQKHAASYLTRCNNYVDYWRNMYPSGVAVGTTQFCPSGGCLALFLNRYDVFYAFKPDLGGSWVEFMGGTMAPTISPAPTYDGGCDNPHNANLDKCFRKTAARKQSYEAWDSLGTVGQFSILLVMFMASTLAISLFIARANNQMRDGESYVEFAVRDVRGKRKKKKLLRKVSRGGPLDEELLSDDDTEVISGSANRRGRSITTRSRTNPLVDIPSRSTKEKRHRSRSKSKHIHEDDRKSSQPTGRSNSEVRSRSRTKRNHSRNRLPCVAEIDDDEKHLPSHSSCDSASRSVSRSRSRSRSKSRSKSRSRKREPGKSAKPNTVQRRLV